MKKQHRSRRVFLSCLGAAVLGCASAARAHHSFAMYDSQKSVALKGVIKEFHYGNPHTLIILAVKKDADELVDYSIETNGSFNLAKNQGWNRESLKPGDAVVALIRPMRDGSPGGDLLKVTFSDGHELIARAPPYPPEDKQ